jgi:hypothetical protein
MLGLPGIGAEPRSRGRVGLSKTFNYLVDNVPYNILSDFESV